MRPSTAIIINLNEPRYNIHTDDWTSCIIDQNDIFYNHPTIFKIICNILNENRNFTNIVFSNLNTCQRHNVYRTLSYFKFPWTKSVDSNGVNSIWADIQNCWIIPIQPFWHTIRSPTKKIALENLYNNITNRPLAPNGDICVTMDEFVKYYIINNKYYGDYNFTPNIYNTDITHSSTEQQPYNLNINLARLSDNTYKKLQLSDMIFDIKDDITDLMFKTIMDKLAEL
jgi:hypothetical protein